jgi:hypothetical protein
MNLAATPTNSERRAACPLCGGQVHPIASRCKHCRGDLIAARAPRTSSMPLRSLPALTATANAVTLPSPSHEFVSDVAVGSEVNVPWWKRWTMVVTAIAAAAIIFAMVMLLWPKKTSEASHAIPPEAPSKMDTNPLPETPPAITPGGKDPWSGNGSVTPPPSSPPSPDGDDIPLKTFPDDPVTAPKSDDRAKFLTALGTAACEKFSTCTDVDPSLVSGVCEGMIDMFKKNDQSTCSVNQAKASKCLRDIQKLDCKGGQSMADAMLLLNDLQSCVEALRC